MTPAQLKAYRKRQSVKLKKRKEKEAIQAEKAEKKTAKKRSQTAKKASVTRKKNKRKKEISARKSVATRKRNIAAAKKELREKEKVQLKQKRAEKRKNKIVVPRNKCIKDMTFEEYSEYKKKYAKIYNDRKKETENKVRHENVSRKLSGKALNIWNNVKMEPIGKTFSRMTEDKRYMMHPRVSNVPVSFKADGFNAYCEITAAVNLYVSGRKKIAEVSLSCFILPVRASGSHLSLRNFWIKDVSKFIPELTDKNFYQLLQPITNKEVNKIMKWSTGRFMKLCIDYAQRHKQITAEILWQTLDKEYAKKNNITTTTLNTMTKQRRK